MNTTRRSSSFWPVAVALMLLVGSGNTVAAQRHALLVGVSEYPSLSERYQLPGSRNDVQLYRRVLAERGFRKEDMTVLADGIREAQLPTRAAIVSSMQDLAKKAVKGDFVFLLFAGHGSQQPAKDLGPDNPEPDGLDETFLPRDIGKWDAPKGTVQNAIIDDEFNAMISGIRNKGAFVWAVFTTCHSGSVTRGIEDQDSRTREVKPAMLGVPKATMDRAAAQAAKMFGSTQSDLSRAGGTLEGGVKLAAGAGGFVAFEAVQSDEEEREERQPAGHPDRQAHGRLAFVLAEVLAMNRSLSYRQAGQQLLQIYAARNYHNTTPLFEGPSLDATVFDDKVVERKRQWPIDRSGSELKVDAGSLHQIGEGAVFAVMADATAPDDKALGYLLASKVGVYQTMLAPAEYNKKPKIDSGVIPAAAFVRLVNANLMLGLSVALPPAAKSPGASDAKVKAALDKLSRQTIPGLRVQWKQPQEGGDVRLYVRDDQLWLMPPGAELIKSGPAKTHAIELTSKGEKEIIDVLSDSLRKIGRVMNLARLGTQMAGTPVARTVDIEIELFRDGKSSKVNLASVPVFRHNDEFEVTVKNGHTRAIDLTVLAIDSSYKIEVLFPDRPGDSNRMEAKSQPFKLPRLRIDAPTAAQESLLFIITEAKPLGERADFSFLAQAELPRTRGRGASDDLMDALVSIGFEAEKTRGPVRVSSATTETTSMRLFRYVTQPQPAGAAKK